MFEGILNLSDPSKNSYYYPILIGIATILLLIQLIILILKDYQKKKYPDLKIFVWTGYLFEDLKNSIDPKIKYILDNVDCIIDGPYVKELRDITLAMRGSSNQRIIYLKN